MVALGASGELQAEAPEAQLFVAEGRQRALVGARRQHLGAGRVEVAELQLGPEPAGEAPELPLVEQGALDVGAIADPRIDVGRAAYGVDMSVRHVDDVETGAHPLQEVVVQVAQAEVETADATPRGEIDCHVVLASGFLFLVMPVVVTMAVPPHARANGICPRTGARSGCPRT